MTSTHSVGWTPLLCCLLATRPQALDVSVSSSVTWRSYDSELVNVECLLRGKKGLPHSKPVRGGVGQHDSDVASPRSPAVPWPKSATVAWFRGLSVNVSQDLCATGMLATGSVGGAQRRAEPSALK